MNFATFEKQSDPVLNPPKNLKGGKNPNAEEDRAAVLAWWAPAVAEREDLEERSRSLAHRPGKLVAALRKTRGIIIEMKNAGYIQQHPGGGTGSRSLPRDWEEGVAEVQAMIAGLEHE